MTLLQWLQEKRIISDQRCRAITWDEMQSWQFLDGKIVHNTRKFFSIVGISTSSPVAQWNGIQQPIILQPEIGILGFLVTNINGQPQILVQAKAEPGNIGDIQVAPSVQATVSNYMRIHGGASTPYLNYFTEGNAGSIMSDTLQSEQGTRFLGKYNRNVTILVKENKPEPVSDFWRWYPVTEVTECLHQDFKVNTDARSVLACSHWETLTFNHKPFSQWKGQGNWGEKLFHSFNAEEQNAEMSLATLQNLLNQWRKDNKIYLSDIPVEKLSGWKINRERIIDSLENNFQVQAYQVQVNGREVEAWDQPLVHSINEGLVVLLCQERNGILFFLFRPSVEIGFSEYVQLGPTIQHDGSDHQKELLKNNYFYNLSRSTTDIIKEISCWQSDEGGRFYQSKAKYCIQEIKENINISNNSLDSSHCWLTLNQIYNLLQIKGIFNNEARSVISLLLTYL